MKTCSSIIVASFVVFTLGSGCSKQETAPAPPVSEAPKAVDNAAADAKKSADTMQQPATAAQDTAQKTAADVQGQADAAKQAVDKTAADAQAQAASLSSRAQTMIEAAQKLLAEKKWSEALKMLTDVSALKLTPEQQAMVDGLKKQAEKMAQDAAASKATDEATKAAGGLLNKK